MASLLKKTPSKLARPRTCRVCGKKGVQASGGFAGSGQQQRFTGGIKDVYGKGMAGVLAGTQEKQAQSLQNIQDIINSWREAAGGIAA